MRNADPIKTYATRRMDPDQPVARPTQPWLLPRQQPLDLALTLHRLGGKSRQSGVALFEAMIEIDAYGA